MNNYKSIIWLLMATFLLPKILLAHFSTNVLSISLTVSDYLLLIAQDIIVAGLYGSILYTLVRLNNIRMVVLYLILGAFLLLFISVDVRVRQLWLRPLDDETVSYALQNIRSLTDGAPLFFNYYAGLGMTFRRALVLGMGTHVLLVVFLLYRIMPISRLGMGTIETDKRVTIRPIAVLLLVLTVTSIFSSKLAYSLQSNAVANFTVLRLGSLFPAPSELQVDENFDGVTTPLSAQFKHPRQILKNVKTYDNIIVVVYESVRWNSTNPPDNTEGVAPALKMLADEGLVAKTYVSIPHSSKAYHSILTGRYPAPGVEILESTQLNTSAIWHDFKKIHNAKTYAFSSLNLSFENMRGQLLAAGVDQNYQVISDSGRLKNSKTQNASSFGAGDDDIYKNGINIIEKNTENRFAAFFFPLAAHYPYECAGSVIGRRSYEDYQACIAYSDRQLLKIVNWLKTSERAKNTLLVVIGDHGESFGERGLFVHNSSLYDEEVTVPWVMWSADGRLQSQQWPKTARQIDLAPTVADLLNIVTSDVPVQGHSLLRKAVDSPMPASFHSTFYADLSLGVVKDGKKHILDIASGRLNTFDLLQDKKEVVSLKIPDDEQTEIKKQLFSFQSYQRNQLRSNVAKH